MNKLKNNLLPYQIEAVEKLSKIKVGALFMEQGTGKTITALEICRQRIEKGKIDKVLWLCPCSAKKNIRNELLKHCSSDLLPAFIICGIETLSTSKRANYYLRNLCDENRVALIVDESLLIKNPLAYRTVNISIIAKKCPYRLILNGTPISRNEADLFSQFYLLDWRILGYQSFYSFAANHLEYDEYGKIRRTLNTDYLARKIAPYTFQISKSDCLVLPDKTYRSRFFVLTDEQYKHYADVADRLLMEVDETKPETIYRLFAALQAVISGKRVVFYGDHDLDHFRTEDFFDQPEENPRIQALLDILPTDEKAIIFCHYESEITALCSLLPSAVRFDGKIPLKRRENNLSHFANGAQYLVANRTCAGYSLNLQFCRNIIYLSNNWDLGTRLQSEDRVHRIGQENDVRITDVCAYNTIDEKIIACLRKKEFLLDSIKNELRSHKNPKELAKSYVYADSGSKRIKSCFFDCSDLEESFHA